jgi:hypothetical protein
MTVKWEASDAIAQAFRAALLLTGSAELAEDAVSDGIAALERGHIGDRVLLIQTAKSAARRRADFPAQSEQAPPHLPLELRWLFLLTPISRVCFTLRFLLGITPRSCSAILRLTIRETEDVLCAALRELSLLEGHNSIRREIVSPA